MKLKDMFSSQPGKAGTRKEEEQHGKMLHGEKYQGIRGLVDLLTCGAGERRA